MPTKEQIYDEKINPLMAQIIAICQKHKIAMLCDFAIPTPEDDSLKCTSALLDASTNPPAEMLRSLELLRPRKVSSMMITTRHADGSKTITAVLG